ncbi:hypothetical protein PMAYCL1PPCAC_16820, partial [Pristionchus mayeri]
RNATKLMSQPNMILFAWAIARIHFRMQFSQLVFQREICSQKRTVYALLSITNCVTKGRSQLLARLLIISKHLLLGVHITIIDSSASRQHSPRISTGQSCQKEVGGACDPYAYCCMYNAIMRCAAMHNRSAVFPILNVSGVKRDTSIALAIRYSIMLQSQNGVHSITLYDEDPKVISRIFYMLGNRCVRHFPSYNYRNTILGCLPEIPCSNAFIRKLPDVIRTMWNAVPHSIRCIPLRTGSVDINVITTSGSGQRTRISIVCADIATVPSPNGATVNAANGILQFGDGVAGVLGRAAGSATVTECNNLIARYRSLGIARLPGGSATITGCGKMNTITTKITHAVGPIVKQGNQPSDEDVYRLKSTYDQVFRLAGLFNLESLVIPFISTGIYGFPSDLGMIIALYAALNALPAHNIKEVIFVHIDNRAVRSFTGLMGGQRELILSSRAEADALIATCCSAFVPPSIRAPMRRRLEKELESVWRQTKSIVTQPLATAARQSRPREAATSSEAPAKRRITPTPPTRHKRPPRALSLDIDDGIRAPVAVTEERGEVIRPGTLRKRIFLAKETPEQAAERKRKDAERKRIKRASQSRAPAETNKEEERGERIVRSRTMSPSTRGHDQAEETSAVSQSLIRDIQPEISAGNVPTETPDEYRERLRKERERIKRSRAVMTSPERTTRKSVDRARKETSRSNAIPSEQQKLREDAKKGMERFRQNESRDQRAARREKNKEEQKRSRASQGSAERKIRQEKDKEGYAAVRAKETPEERTQRQTVDAFLHRRAREKETPEHREARKKRDRETTYYHRHDPLRPLRKPGSSILTEEEKDFTKKLPKAFELGPIHVCQYCDALTYSGRCCSQVNYIFLRTTNMESFIF